MQVSSGLAISLVYIFWIIQRKGQKQWWGFLRIFLNYWCVFEKVVKVAWAINDFFILAYGSFSISLIYFTVCMSQRSLGAYSKYPTISIMSSPSKTRHWPSFKNRIDPYKTFSRTMAPYSIIIIKKTKLLLHQQRTLIIAIPSPRERIISLTYSLRISNISLQATFTSFTLVLLISIDRGLAIPTSDSKDTWWEYVQVATLGTECL